MRHPLTALTLLLACAAPAGAHGLLIPVEKAVPPLAMLNHIVKVSIDDQVAVTRVEQTFRNHTDRPLEATYVFPVPKGASVQKFSMWLDGKEVKGELVEAAKARQIYTSIVQRTMDPGLLEYLGSNLLQLKVFPVPARGEQKVALSYTSVAPAENGLVTYTYPLKTDGKATATLEKFSVQVALKAQQPLQNIYSPTHAITVTRPNDREANVVFEKDQALLDRDFQLYYSAGGKDVGLTSLTQRPSSGKNGFFMLLISPRAELSKEQQVPRDMVFVLDTSGSMRGKRIEQAKGALKYCLKNLQPNDRFGLMNFATTVNKYTEQLLPANSDELQRATKWVEQLEATGGTAINDALAAALEMRTKETGRPFTIVFFTDGRPTIGETDPEKILKNVAAKNTASTRIFTFGVGDDVNATMLDSLSEQSRALSTYVRESEDIEAKVSGLYAKISNPVLTNLKLVVGGNIKLSEVYPPQLPDLFHGNQLVVLGRYQGDGHAAVTLTGQVGDKPREFVYETQFPKQTKEDKGFVEDLWARRKVGYLLDEIRRNGEKKELVDEVVTLAKRYGISTPYTSYLIVPDVAVPVVRGPRPGGGGGAGGFVPPGLAPAGSKAGGGKGHSAPTKTVTEFAKDLKGDAAAGRGHFEDERLARKPGAEGDRETTKGWKEAGEQKKSLDSARKFLRQRQLEEVQAGSLGVDLSIQSNNLRNQERLTQTAVRRVQGRNCLEVGGVWIDEGFDPKMKTVAVKAMSKAYFQILERQPSVKEVFRLGNYVVWVTPSGTALVIDTSAGREEIADDEIDRLFTKN
jgi:Ca-activated chloride channel family protein